MAKSTSAESAGDAPLLPLGESMGFLVREIHRMQSRLLQDELLADDISGGGWYFLRVLWDEDGLTQRELSLKIGVNEATTRMAIDRMEKENLVVRTQDPGDRRKWLLELTPRARQLRTRLLNLAIDINDRASEGLSKAERAQLVASLQLVYKNLARISPGPDRRRVAAPSDAAPKPRPAPSP